MRPAIMPRNLRGSHKPLFLVEFLENPAPDAAGELAELAAISAQAKQYWLVDRPARGSVAGSAKGDRRDDGVARPAGCAVDRAFPLHTS